MLVLIGIDGGGGGWLDMDRAVVVATIVRAQEVNSSFAMNRTTKLVRDMGGSCNEQKFLLHRKGDWGMG
jgi:hypothetical protein